MSAGFDTERRAGKTTYALRRRAVTRTSGFSSHPDATGGDYKEEACPSFLLPGNKTIRVVFELPDHHEGEWLGYGLWYCCSAPIRVEISGGPTKYTEKQYRYPDWSKVGSMWKSEDPEHRKVTIYLIPEADIELALFEPRCGIVHHRYLENSRPQILTNMYLYAPEGLFIQTPGVTETITETAVENSRANAVPLYLKSCNRCARFLPINIGDERNSLSFSNHCKAAHRVPCRHRGFGILSEIDSRREMHLTYGFQLECRFCKKFTVNAAHNPQRTAGQMKEDAARRRAFEVLVSELYQTSPKQKFRQDSGQDLAEYTYHLFGGRCFNCNQPLPGDSSWHLDHTRPLSLLWPLDQFATALCADCNSAKSDRLPKDFYSDAQLRRLESITGLSYKELASPTPNLEVLRLITRNRLWFFEVFLYRVNGMRFNEGKLAATQIVKAVQKVIDQAPEDDYVDLLSEQIARNP